MRAARVGIDGAATPAEGVVVVEGSGVGGSRGEGGVAAQLLGGVGEGIWERPPCCGMWDPNGPDTYMGVTLLKDAK